MIIREEIIWEISCWALAILRGFDGFVGFSVDLKIVVDCMGGA